MTPSALTAALADRYKIERELGQGGMATVYLAEDLKHHRKVAIKVLRPELAAVIGAERFLNEIKTTASLQHPDILPLFDSGASGGFLFYVMPLVEGGSLRERLTRERQLPIADAIRITVEIAEGLDFAHRRGVIHRDIKPENILLHDGRAMLADFGIAVAIRATAEERLTEAGLSLGTPAYMSPEQACGERDLDPRSDVYALGCVLYEMLAGEPPFSGTTAQAMIAKRLSEPVPHVSTLRDVSPTLESAVTRALSKAPADRFPTAAAFATALASVSTAAVPGVRRQTRLGGWVAAGALVGLAVAVVVATVLRPKASASDPNLIMIAPFDVLDPKLGLWREGVVDILSRSLDGAGPLRTVSPSVVLSRWHGRSDRVTATQVAGAVGAGLTAIGSIGLRGGDSMALRATLLDMKRSAPIGEIEVRGPVGRIGELVDSLGLEMLNALSRDRPVAAVRQAAIASASLPALKAFLQGEQHYRRSEYDSALVAYSEAIARDSGFGLAYHRMSQVLSWDPRTAALYHPLTEYVAHATMLNHGLGARDSMLVAMDSALWASGDFFRLQRKGMATLKLAIRRFPGDPEVWYALGEVEKHVPWVLSGALGRPLDAFNRAIALDSGFSPAYEHLYQLALQDGRPDKALTYARAGVRLKATDGNSSFVRLAGTMLLDSTNRRDTAVTRLLDSAGENLFRLAIEVYLELPDSAETAVALLRRLVAAHFQEGEVAPPFLDSLMRLQYLATALAARGHLQQANETDRTLLADAGAARFSSFWDPFVDLALLGTVPVSVARTAFAKSLQPGVKSSWGGDVSPRYMRGLPWWAMQHDTASLALFRIRMSEAAARAGGTLDSLRARYLQAAGGAYLALVRGDTSSALGQFAALPDTICALVECFQQKLMQATLLVAERQDDRAAVILDDWLPSASASPTAVLGRLARAGIAERLGDRDSAARGYQYVLDAWRQADPDLQSYVAEARAGLRRLTSEPR